MGAQDSLRIVVVERSYDFDRVIRGSVLNRTYTLKNEGSLPLSVRHVRMTPPLIATQIPSQVPPGGQASITVKLDTSKLTGPYSGQIAVSFGDPVPGEEILSFSGFVFPPIELLPLPAFFVATQRGQPKQQSIDIINHERRPLQIIKVEHSDEYFVTQLETIEEGQKYRLSLRMKTSGRGGKHTELITVYTSSELMPLLRVPANTYLRERVYCFPDEIDLGNLPVHMLRSGNSAATALAQTFMLYQEGGSQFEATFACDLPLLQMRAVRGPKGDRYQVTVELRSDKAQVGPLKGSIRVSTNDPEFPEITLPVTGSILDR